MKLMIVDDSMIIRNKIARENTLTGITKIVRATNGREAVRICHDIMPDIVTMDLTMPEMDGTECIKELVKLKPDIIILVISALADKSTAIEAIRNGARGFLCKPFTSAELNQSLNRLIESAAQAKSKSYMSAKT